MGNKSSAGQFVSQIEGFLRLGLIEEADRQCRELTRLYPQESRGWYYAGFIALLGRRFTEAEPLLRRATEQTPNEPIYWDRLGIALLEMNRTAEAEACARRSIQLDRGPAYYWSNLGHALFRGEKWAEAAAAFQEVILRDPEGSDGWCDLGAAEQRRGRMAEAQQAYEKSVSLNPSNIDALANLGYLAVECGDAATSVDLLKAVLARDPGHRSALLNIALVQLHTGALPEAESHIRRLQAMEGESPTGLALLGSILLARSEVGQAISALRRSVEIAPAPDRHSKLLLALQYSSDADSAQLLSEHRVWNSIYAKSASPLPSFACRAFTDVRPLRVGFVSVDFGQHPIGFLALGALEHLDRSECLIACYSDRTQTDDYTRRFHSRADLWRDTRGQTCDQLARQIERDEVDILIDLMGHTVGNRLLAFARKPAPVQMTWLGYVGTTGLSAMDFLLADWHHVHAGEEIHYSESVIRLPNGYACYQPPAETPDVKSLPALATSCVTFGCFNNPAKYTTRMFELWSEILRRLPVSQIFFKYGGLDQKEVQASVLGHFAKNGIEPRRVQFEGKSPIYELLDQYNRVDIALDTQPYSGGLTTCEALWMGVPVITFSGKTFAGRHSTSHLITAGYPQFIAKDEFDYVELAVSWANQLDRLAIIRSKMREQVRKSSLCDATQFAGDFLDALRRAWRSRNVGES